MLLMRKHRLGAGDRHGVGQRMPEQHARILVGFDGERIAVEGRLGNHFGRQVVERDVAELALFHAVCHQLEYRPLDAGRRDVGFQTPLAAAAADAAGVADRNVPQLAGESGISVDQLAVGHEAAAQTGPERDDQKVLHAFRSAVDHFAYGRGVRIVGQNDGQGGEEALHLFDHADRSLPRQIGRVLNRPPVIVAVRGPDTHAHELDLVAGGFEQVLDADIQFLDIQVRVRIIARGKYALAENMALVVH